MTKILTPARVPMPGLILSEELEERGWTQKDLSEIMGRPQQAISEIINGKKQIVSETAIELAEVFDTSAQFWLNLEANYRLWKTKKEKNAEDIARKSFLYTIAPIRELIKREWIQANLTLDQLENRIFSLLEIKSSHEFQPCAIVNFRCADNRQPADYARFVWMKRVEELTKPQNVASFDRNVLEKAMPEILACNQNPEDIAKIPALLGKLGVRFAIVKHLEKTYLDGAAFYLGGDKSKPIIALTLRYDRIDITWFNLVHELGHIALGHEGILDVDLDGSKKVGEIIEAEAEANQFARDYLISANDYDHFVSSEVKFNSDRIMAFSKSINRHPSIVIGRLLREKLIHHQKSFSEYFIQASLYLEQTTASAL
jgi:HTH-type transcriptional regulator / antitoxin HigA